MNIALLGEGNLADIARLVATSDFTVDVVDVDAKVKDYDAVIVTDVLNPQGTYDLIKHKVAYHKLFVSDLLHISKVAQ